MKTDQTASTTIDSYIAAFSPEFRGILQKLRDVISAEAPDAVEAISYGMPTFKLKGKNLVHFAGWKEHIGFHPTPTGTSAFEKEISRFKFAKGSIQFALNEPVPYDLVKKIVKF